MSAVQSNSGGVHLAVAGVAPLDEGGEARLVPRMGEQLGHHGPVLGIAGGQSQPLFYERFAHSVIHCYICCFSSFGVICTAKLRDRG